MLEEELVAAFIAGIAFITGNTKEAEKVGKQILKMKGKLWLLSFALWSVIIVLWLSRAKK